MTIIYSNTESTTVINPVVDFFISTELQNSNIIKDTNYCSIIITNTSNNIISDTTPNTVVV